MDTINKRIEVVINSHNLTASSFADQIGVQRSSVSHILSGRNKPSITFIQKVVANFPKVDAQWLITGTQQKKDTLRSSDSGITDKKVEKSVSDQKEIEKIVVFYTDKTFESYQP